MHHDSDVYAGTLRLLRIEAPPTFKKRWNLVAMCTCKIAVAVECVLQITLNELVQEWTLPRRRKVEPGGTGGQLQFEAVLAKP